MTLYDKISHRRNLSTKLDLNLYRLEQIEKPKKKNHKICPHSNYAPLISFIFSRKPILFIPVKWDCNSSLVYIFNASTKNLDEINFTSENLVKILSLSRNYYSTQVFCHLMKY